MLLHKSQELNLKQPRLNEGTNGMSAKKGWNIISKEYQEKTQISLEDVHYGPISPGELELKLLGNVKGKRVLEIGCGGGQNTIVLAKWGAKSAGLDISKEQIKYARKLAKKNNVTAPFYVGNMENLSMFKNESFNIVLSSHAIGYAEDPKQVFQEVFRVLQRNGLFVFCVSHPITVKGRKVRYGGRTMWGLGNYFDRRRRMWTWKMGGKTAKFYGYHRILQDYFDWLVSAGFSVERVLEPEPYPLNRMTEAQKHRIPYFEEGYLKDYEIWRKTPFTLLFKTRKP
jgi:SAM-dependent methyltransferase